MAGAGSPRITEKGDPNARLAARDVRRSRLLVGSEVPVDDDPAGVEAPLLSEEVEPLLLTRRGRWVEAAPFAEEVLSLLRGR